MSWFVLFFIVVIVPIITSEEVGVDVTCVSVNFENGLENFDDSTGQCVNIRSPWEVGQYADIDIPPPHESSTTFIKSDESSCVSSFQFQISATGILEVTFYMSTTLPLEFLSVFVNVINDMGLEVQANFEMFSLSTPGLINDSWNTMNFTVGSRGTYLGFISIFGSKNPSSKILLDHFRYIPPDFEETHEDCVIYDTGEDSTPASGEETTTASSDDSTTASDEETTTASSDDSTTASDEETTTASSDDSTTAPDEDTTTESDEEKTTEPYITTTESTEEPEDLEDNDSFWSPLTITMTVILVIIPLVGITICVCEKSKRGAVNKPIFDDYSEPIPAIVPRVKRM